MKQSLAVLLITRLPKLFGGFQGIARYQFSLTEHTLCVSSQLEIKKPQDSAQIIGNLISTANKV